ncbi:MAG: sugar ABC transporter permease [Anaerolineales bacterium]|nr:sugar ABC transporter permease [Anaerolineales bacterium]
MASFRTPWSKLSPLRRKEAQMGFLFTLPWIISLLALTIYPILDTVYLSFTEYSVLQAPEWIGFGNYKEIFFNDPSIKPAVINSLYYALLSVPVGLILSLALALLLNMRSVGIGIYRTLFYLPSLVPPVAATITFLVMFEPRGGLINTFIRLFGVPAPFWFDDPTWSKPGLIIMSLWGIGYLTLIFLAGLQDVPVTLLEAAEIDGANTWQKFWHITIPMLSNVILFNLVMNIIWSFQVFTQALVIGGTNGTPLESTLMVMVLIYRNAFRYFKMGYASAIAFLMFVVIMIVTMLIFRSSDSWVYTESSQK